jgi:hypothetical protein
MPNKWLRSRSKPKRKCLDNKSKISKIGFMTSSSRKLWPWSKNRAPVGTGTLERLTHEPIKPILTQYLSQYLSVRVVSRIRIQVSTSPLISTTIAFRTSLSTLLTTRASPSLRCLPRFHEEGPQTSRIKTSWLTCYILTTSSCLRVPIKRRSRGANSSPTSQYQHRKTSPKLI